MLGKSCVLTAIPVCFFYPKTRKTSPMYCGYSNCLFCPKTCKASPMYIWLFQLSFLSLNTRTNAIPIFLSIPSHARQVLCTYTVPCPFVFFVPTFSKQVVSIHIVASIPVLIVLSVLKYRMAQNFDGGKV